MVKPHIPPATGETVCPACGAGIKIAPSTRRRRVQCPNCREVVVLENLLEKPPEIAVIAARVPVPVAPAETPDRFQALEARVAALEAALRDALAARPSVVAASPAPRKLLWVSSTPNQAPAFSQEQAQALFHNLGRVQSQAITIRIPTGDAGAKTNAQWFKTIFERAGWIVRGPEEIAPGVASSALSLSVPELPVGENAAATYLALKAAGFETIPVLDSATGGESGPRSAAIALTLPPAKAA